MTAPQNARICRMVFLWLKPTAIAGTFFAVLLIAGRVAGARKRAAMADGSYARRFVYIENDGTARELHSSEQAYFNTTFPGPDGPYWKRSYSQRDGWGEIGGFLERSKLPPGHAVAPAPQEKPPTFEFTRAEYIQFLRRKGIDVKEFPDGSYVIPTQKPEIIAAIRSRRTSLFTWFKIK